MVKAVWQRLTRNLRTVAAVAQIVGAGVLVGLVWVWRWQAGLAAVGAVVLAWGLLVAWADSR